MSEVFTTTVNEFRHEAFLYAGMDDFLAGTVPFVRGGVQAGEPVLGADAGSVLFADMADVGANPARIIPAWQDFVSGHGGSGRRLRGIGEPIWKGRGPAELIECQRHESLLNTAFASADPWWLLCPYDTEALDPAVIDEARRSHEFVSNCETGGRSNDYRGLEASGAAFDAPLPEPPTTARELSFRAATLFAVRELVGGIASGSSLAPNRVNHLVVAVNEVATNSLVHGGGEGTLRVWRDSTAVTCEVRDVGRFDSALADRERPASGAAGPRGLWLANQLCDLVQIRTFPDATVVRLHMWLEPADGSNAGGEPIIESITLA